MTLRQGALIVALIACVSVSLTSFAGASGHPPLPKDNLFTAINQRNIAEVENRINGSANSRNQIPTGTVLVYRTSDGNSGKLQILHYGYDLRLRWVTYRPNGTIRSRGDNLRIRGTYMGDLDRGVEVDTLGPHADFWWEQADHVHRYLVFKNHASFTVVS
jgi:hypothetical protein